MRRWRATKGFPIRLCSSALSNSCCKAPALRNWPRLRPLGVNRRRILTINSLPPLVDSMSCGAGRRPSSAPVHSLGAQAGEERLRKVAQEAGFSSLRLAAQTPVNLILELTL